MPPDTLTVAVPMLVKQLDCVVVMVGLRGEGWVMVTVLVTVHPRLSVTNTV